VFVPAAKPFLVSLIASGTRPEDKNPNSMCYSCLFNLNCYFFTYEELMSSLFYLGQISGSPKPSPFPNLPDMSPKKVSSSHNVYVSPLRQTKVFFFIMYFIALFRLHLVLSSKLTHITTNCFGKVVRLGIYFSIAYACLKFYNIVISTTIKPFSPEQVGYARNEAQQKPQLSMYHADEYHSFSS